MTQSVDEVKDFLALKTSFNPENVLDTGNILHIQENAKLVQREITSTARVGLTLKGDESDRL
jgi:hypothetical protein